MANVQKSKVVKVEAKEEVAPMTKQNGKSKRNLPVINLTRAEAEALTAKGVLEIMGERISERRAKKVLIGIVRDGTITITEPVTLMDWTYRTVSVEGIDNADKVPGFQKPKKMITVEEFGKLDGPAVAALLEEHTTEKRASQVMLALIEYGFHPTPEQLVNMSNARIAVEGVATPKIAKRDAVVLVKGISLNGQ